MATNQEPAPRATSNYRQLRLTLTEGLDGRWSGGLYLKPYNRPWQVKHHLGDVRTEEPMNPRSLEDALMVIVDAIRSDIMPRD